VLLARGHRVPALARQESLNRVPAGTTTVVGDALRVDSSRHDTAGDTVVHLVARRIRLEQGRSLRKVIWRQSGLR